MLEQLSQLKVASWPVALIATVLAVLGTANLLMFTKVLHDERQLTSICLRMTLKQAYLPPDLREKCDDALGLDAKTQRTIDEICTLTTER